MINGTTIEGLLCDKLKGIIDTSQDYTPESLLTVINTSNAFELQDLLAWFMCQVPTYGPCDAAWGASAWTDQQIIDTVNQWHGSNIVSAIDMQNCGDVYKLYMDDPNRDTTIKQSLVDLILA